MLKINESRENKDEYIHSLLFVYLRAKNIHPVSHRETEWLTFSAKSFKIFTKLTYFYDKEISLIEIKQ